MVVLEGWKERAHPWPDLMRRSAPAGSVKEYCQNSVLYLGRYSEALRVLPSCSSVRHQVPQSMNATRPFREMPASPSGHSSVPAGWTISMASCIKHRSGNAFRVDARRHLQTESRVQRRSETVWASSHDSLICCDRSSSSASVSLRGRATFPFASRKNPDTVSRSFPDVAPAICVSRTSWASDSPGEVPQSFRWSIPREVPMGRVRNIRIRTKSQRYCFDTSLSACIWIVRTIDWCSQLKARSWCEHHTRQSCPGALLISRRTPSGVRVWSLYKRILKGRNKAQTRHHPRSRACLRCTVSGHAHSWIAGYQQLCSDLHQFLCRGQFRVRNPRLLSGCFTF